MILIKFASILNKISTKSLISYSLNALTTHCYSSLTDLSYMGTPVLGFFGEPNLPGRTIDPVMFVFNTSRGDAHIVTDSADTLAFFSSVCTLYGASVVPFDQNERPNLMFLHSVESISEFCNLCQLASSTALKAGHKEYSKSLLSLSNTLSKNLHMKLNTFMKSKSTAKSVLAHSPVNVTNFYEDYLLLQVSLLLKALSLKPVSAPTDDTVANMFNVLHHSMMGVPSLYRALVALREVIGGDTLKAIHLKLHPVSDIVTALKECHLNAVKAPLQNRDELNVLQALVYLTQNAATDELKSKLKAMMKPVKQSKEASAEKPAAEVVAKSVKAPSTKAKSVKAPSKKSVKATASTEAAATTEAPVSTEATATTEAPALTEAPESSSR